MKAGRGHMLLLAAAMVVAWPLSAAPGPGDGFATGKLEDYLELGDRPPVEVSLVQIVGLRGSHALAIVGNARARFKPIAVAAGTKYTLSFRGCFSGGEAIEENPRLEVALMPRGNLAILPHCDIDFLDAERQPIQVRHPGAIGLGLPFRDWHDYAQVFHTPAHAAFVSLSVRAAPGITFTMESVAVAPTADEGAINANPDFRGGRYNYSGWASLAAGARMVLTKEGKPAFDAQYGSFTAMFPVAEPGTYQATARFTSTGYASTIEAHFVDAQGKPTGDIRVRDRTCFVLPERTASGCFMVRSGVLEELRLVRLGAAEEIERFLKQ